MPAQELLLSRMSVGRLTGKETIHEIPQTPRHQSQVAPVLLPELGRTARHGIHSRATIGITAGTVAGRYKGVVDV